MSLCILRQELTDEIYIKSKWPHHLKEQILRVLSVTFLLEYLMLIFNRAVSLSRSKHHKIR